MYSTLGLKGEGHLVENGWKKQWVCVYVCVAPYAAATPPQVQQVATVQQIGTVPGQQATYMTTQPMYGAVNAVPQGMVNIQQQPTAVAMPYATTIQTQQQQSTLGVQSSAPMTTQQYLQTMGLQQQQGAQIALGQTQQTNIGTTWMQQQQQPVQQQLVGQFQRQQPYQQATQTQQAAVPQQQAYQSSGLVKLNIV
ncbi:unnamed protein product [Nippostrongylus brasiliensis]|uniref:Circadian locomoter output cycles protein kaput-like n=1 Tax=Nippostrongylus brasiliensis TaxID=27835 RepID=A0A0N4XF16_NIPBR|nr:unnamed protein product [Nippostrongylus brasiliensis]